MTERSDAKPAMAPAQAANEAEQWAGETHHKPAGWRAQIVRNMPPPHPIMANVHLVMSHFPRATAALTTVAVTTLVFDTLTAGQRDSKQLIESGLHGSIEVRFGDWQ